MWCWITVVVVWWSEDDFLWGFGMIYIPLSHLPQMEFSGSASMLDHQLLAESWYSSTSCHKPCPIQRLHINKGIVGSAKMYIIALTNCKEKIGAEATGGHLMWSKLIKDAIRVTEENTGDIRYPLWLVVSGWWLGLDEKHFGTWASKFRDDKLVSYLQYRPEHPHRGF